MRYAHICLLIFWKIRNRSKQNDDQAYALPVHSSSILLNCAFKQSFTHNSISCRDRFSVVTFVEYTLTAIFAYFVLPLKEKMKETIRKNDTAIALNVIFTGCSNSIALMHRWYNASACDKVQRRQRSDWHARAHCTYVAILRTYSSSSQPSRCECGTGIDWKEWLLCNRCTVWMCHIRPVNCVIFPAVHNRFVIIIEMEINILIYAELWSEC